MYSPETQARIAELTYKSAQGLLSQEDVKEAVRLLRQERKTAVQAAAKKRSAAKVAVRSADDLLQELEV